MTTREFDPVFSAALRNELEALADGAEQPAAAAARRPVLLRPQLWISLATAAVLLVVTVGVLRLTHTAAPPAEPGSKLIDPLSSVTDPAADNYVARSVQTLLHSRGSGPGTVTFDVPSDVPEVRVYIACAADVPFTIGFDGADTSSGDCSREVGGFFSLPIKAGQHDVSVTVKKGTDWALLLIAEPVPTVSDGPLIDPLTQVRDRRNPDALVGDTQPILQESGTTVGNTTASAFGGALPKRIRAFVVCTPSSSTFAVRIDGHLVTGCMNSIAHWFDFTRSAGSVAVDVERTGGARYSLLLVPAPADSTDSPANTLLPYPDLSNEGTVVAQTRGAGAETTGTYVHRRNTIRVAVTCRGTGWVAVDTGNGSTSTRRAPCSTSKPSGAAFIGDADDSLVGSRLRWTVIPHGDISWTVQLVESD